MNNITPIYLVNDTILLQLISGPKFITKEDLCYHKLKKHLPASESKVLELLKTPPLPDGIFEVYLQNEQIYIKNITNTKLQYYTITNAEINPQVVVPNTLDTLLGVFTSLDEVRNYLPEYFI